MYNAIMDPELMRVAQEQMSRISPQDLAKIQQQMMSNPELVRLASESMKNMRPEDMRRAAEQLKHTRTEDMVEISEKVGKAKPEEIAAMKAHADARISYETSAAQMLKQEGNELHSCGKYTEAADKYLHAKKNLQGIPSAKGGILQLQCSLNLMSCYLKTAQYRDCIQEGSEVLSYDSENVKALYRRGQAYKELGNLEAAVLDFRKARRISPEDETIVEVFRDTNEKLVKAGAHKASSSLVIEEIEEEETGPVQTEHQKCSSVEYSVSEPVEAVECSQNGGLSPRISSSEAEFLKSLKENPETVRLLQNYVSNANPETVAAMGGGGMSADMIKTATDMISKMKPEELQKMVEVASSLNGNAPKLPTLNLTGDRSRPGSQIPEMTPEMIKMASDKLKEMSSEELQKMLEVASSMNVNGTQSSESGSRLSPQLPEMTPEMLKVASDRMSKMSPEELQKMFEMTSSTSLTGTPFTDTDNTTQRSESGSPSSTAEGSHAMDHPDGGSSSRGSFPSVGNVQASSGLRASSADLQESLRNSMKDPAMQQMFASMMKNISPEMMANMSEQYGMKLSKEDAAKAQQVMSSLSPEDLDEMMKWAERVQKGVETVKKTKNWVLGKPGLILAIFMLILAFIFHQLGFIGG